MNARKFLFGRLSCHGTSNSAALRRLLQKKLSERLESLFGSSWPRGLSYRAVLIREPGIRIYSCRAEVIRRADCWTSIGTGFSPEEAITHAAESLVIPDILGGTWPRAAAGDPKPAASSSA